MDHSLENPSDPAGDPGHNPTTRSEALRAALQAGTSPQPPREFSTLVRRSEPVPEHLECADPRTCIEHADPEMRAELAWPEEAARALVDALLAYRVTGSRSVRAGGTHSSGDVLDDECEGEPGAAAGNQAENDRQSNED